MFDARLRPYIDPPLNAAGRALARLGVSANQVTLAGLALGLASGWCIVGGSHVAALALLLAGRLLDGLDGAVARATQASNFGGYLDIVADFAFYVTIPVAFGLADRDNLPAALLLVASFTLTGISFLAYAVMAAKTGLETEAHGKKSFFYSTGLAEGTETIITFVLMCLFPGWFTLIALIYAGLCLATVIQRSIAAWQDFA